MRGGPLSTDWTELTKTVNASLRTLRQGSPEVMKAFAGLAQAALHENVLDKKSKELIALAIGWSSRIICISRLAGCNSAGSCPAIVKLFPKTAQTPVAVNVTGSPELEDADREIAGSP